MSSLIGMLSPRRSKADTEPSAESEQPSAEPVAEDESKAAATVQKSWRGKQSRSETKRMASKAAKGVASVGSKAATVTGASKAASVTVGAAKTAYDKVDAGITDANEKKNAALIEAKTGATRAAISASVRAGISVGLKDDPWIPATVKRVVGDGIIVVVDELLDRSKQDALETSGKGSLEFRNQVAAAKQPQSWPPPPDRPTLVPPSMDVLKSAFNWMRAKMLYAIYPADKTLSYVVFKEPWMLAVTLLLVCPFGVSTFAWLVLFGCIITVPDEYQLLNYTMSFKAHGPRPRSRSPPSIHGSPFRSLYALIICGLLPIFKNWLVFYLAQTSAPAETDEAVAHLSLYSHFLTFLFLTNWGLCYYALFRYKKVRRMHYAEGVPRLVLTGDEEGNDWEVTLAIKYDAIATAVVVLLMSVDYALRVHATADELSARSRLWWDFLTIALSLSAAPWALFKLPTIGSLVHGLRATGFDQSGALRLEMSLGHARAKWDQEQGTPRGVVGGAASVIASSSSAVKTGTSGVAAGLSKISGLSPGYKKVATDEADSTTLV